MQKKMVKAIRLVNGYSDNLRVKLQPAKEEKVRNFILNHLIDLYGVGIYDKLGTKFNPQPGVDAADYLKVLEFADREARAVALGETED